MPDDELDALVRRVLAKPYRWRADTLGAEIGMLDEVRTRLRITTIRPMGVTLDQLNERRRGRWNAKRRTQTRAEYEGTSVSKAEPWKAEGMSRAKWYRLGRHRETGPRQQTFSDRVTHTCLTPLAAPPAAPPQGFPRCGMRLGYPSAYDHVPCSDRRRANHDEDGLLTTNHPTGAKQSELAQLRPVVVLGQRPPPRPLPLLQAETGIGYKLFTMGLIPSMATKDMQRVYRALKQEREAGRLPWDWIVDEHADNARVPQWDDPEAYASHVMRQYRRERWDMQPVRVEVWSEKGTVRGVLEPVIADYYVTLRIFHGFSGSTPIYDIAQDTDKRPLVALYVGDFDPSGMYMSEVDLPARLERYGGDHITVKRVAVTGEDLLTLPTFDAKKTDPRHDWFISSYGNDECAELDALDPRILRDRVEREIESSIEDLYAWERCAIVERAERQSLVEVMTAWTGSREE